MRRFRVWIAAAAEVHGLTVVTRDAGDFTPLVARILNPWIKV